MSCFEVIAEDVDCIDNDRYVLYAGLPTLQAMASHSLARAVVFSHISHVPKTAPFDVDKFYEDIRAKLKGGCCEWIGCAKLPRPIEEIVKESLRIVRINLQNWDSFYMRPFLLKIRPIEVFDPNYFVWLPNGTIDDEKTAVNFLSSGKFNEVQKFFIMSMFCMEDEISTVHVSSLHEEFNVRTSRRGHSTFFYWLCHLKNELHKIPLDGFNSIDTRMAKKVFTRSAFLYFWNRLGAEDQIALAVDLLKGYFPFAFSQKKFLAMMSSHQQHRILSQIPDKIIRYSRYSDSPQFINWVWKHSKNSMSSEKFSAFIMALLEEKLHIEERMSALIEIWNSVSDQLRNDVARMILHDVLGYYLPDPETFRGEPSPCSTALHFLHLLLSQQDDDFRQELTLNGVHYFESYASDPWPFEEIVDICFPSAESLHELKSRVTARSRSRNSFFRCTCDKLMKLTKLDILIRRLRFYLPDEETVQEFVEELIQTGAQNWGCDYMTDMASWREFCVFIDEVFPNAEQASQTKKLFVLSTTSSLAGYTLNDERMISMKEITKSVLDEDELATFKQSLAKAIAELVTDHDFWWLEAKYFIECAAWCCDGDQSTVEEFQSTTLPVEAITNKFFGFMVKYLSTYYDNCRDMFDVLDEYVVWYLPDVEDRKRYKMNKITKPDVLLVFEWLIDHSDSEWDTWEFVEAIIRWGFDGDQQAMDEFKSRNPRYIRPVVDRKA